MAPITEEALIASNELVFRRLHHNSLYVLLMSVLFALLLCVMIDAGHAWVWAWWVLVLFSQCVRHVYESKKLSQQDTPQALRLRWATVLASGCGLIKGLFVFVFWLASEAQLLLSTMVYTGFAALAMSHTLGQPRIYRAYVWALLLPTSIGWALHAAWSWGWLPALTTVVILVFAVELTKMSSVVWAQFLKAQTVALREHEFALQQTEHAKALHQANEAKNLFLASTSHDFKQPLFALSTALQVFRSGAKPDIQQKAVTLMERTLGGLNRHIEDLMEISQLESGSLRPVVDLVNVSQLLYEVADEFSVLSLKKGLLFEVNIEEKLWAETDEALLRRVIQNLLSNAFRYTASGVVSLSAHAADDALSIAVRDTGCGISEQDQVRIFEDFFQVNKPIHKHAEGHGLGLSIVRRLCKQLQIDITLQSVLGEGACFTLRVSLFKQGELLTEQRPPHD